MTPEDVLSQAELAAARASNFVVSVEDDSLVVLCPVGQNALPLELSTATAAVRVITRAPNSIAELLLPAGGQPCTVYAEVEVGFNARGDGRLVVEMAKPTGVNVTGEIKSIRLVAPKPNADSGDSPPPASFATPINASLPKVQRLEVVGGTWSLGDQQVASCSVLDAELSAGSVVRCEKALEVAGRCVLTKSSHLGCETFSSSGTLIVSEGHSEIETQEILGTLTCQVESNGALTLRTRRGSPTIAGTGRFMVECVDNTPMTHVTVRAPDAFVYVQWCQRLDVAASFVRVNHEVELLEGAIGILDVTQASARFGDGCRIGAIQSADSAELFNLPPYALHLKDLGVLDNARLVTFRFERGRRHRKRINALEAGQPPESSMVFWYRIGLLLEQHGGTGAARATVRRTEHEYRRRGIHRVGWHWPAERVWLTAYKFLGYGDSAMRPLLAHAVICVGIVEGLLPGHIRRQPGRSWAVLWRLAAQPLRFFMKDEATLQLAPLVPHGHASTLLPFVPQVVGAVLLGMTINAIRRLVKAR